MMRLRSRRSSLVYGSSKEEDIQSEKQEPQGIQLEVGSTGYERMPPLPQAEVISYRMP
jgi:hypothetical protein